MEEFATIKAKAWSLPPGTDPQGLELLHVEENRFGTFKYYRNKSTGEYWYSSSVTDEFDRWVKEREKERRQCSRRSERISKKNA